ncbi:glycosyl hydrolase family protein [Cryobacterium sp. TMT1-3]|uniref:Glycosyl hydrolase family protein n=1 Tax=Cryobacterium luteum TaxID=1424661 RepID=A0A1H8DSM2_9MICO|nr:MULTISPECIES: family 1 glycosylhydrolase [Cryobacterium]TFB89713.1 glycosyl hydrolase family protein [Cryobacterium luteum]TFC25425.1 glycosyl hydrolase family protein [Cryobacterium sp. TMT1-3]SEN10230.1 beta-glucosidase [Cryobacterium luteum]
MNPTPSSPSSRAVAARDWEHRAGELGDRLPTGFEVAVATSAFQVEGAARDGGRGDSVWDAFSQQSGRIRDGSNASVSADHVKNYADDTALLRDLGVDSYRFSFGWTRLQPDGRGALHRNGLAFYDRLLDALLADGIRSTATLSHWDTPAALRGGWLNRDTAGRFADYAHAVGEAFGDRLDAWITLNEPATVTANGYALGTHAPGRALLFDALPSAHHQLLGHGLAVQALRAADVRGRIGLVNSHTPVQSATDRDQDRSYAALYDLMVNRLFADPVLLGRFPDPLEPFAVELRSMLETDPADLRTIHQPLDFYGLSYTEPARVSAGPTVRTTPEGQPIPTPSWPFHFEPFREHPTTSTGAVNAPEYVAVALAELAGRYADLPPVYLSLAGGAFFDQADARHQVHDPARIDYLAEHLVTALDATVPGASAEAIDLAGVTFWSLLDAFEWDAGYTQPTGLVHVDFTDDRRTRTPKQSFRWLQHALANR